MTKVNPGLKVVQVVMTVTLGAKIQTQAVVIAIQTVRAQEKRRKKKRKGNNMPLTVLLKEKSKKNQTSLILLMLSNL